MSDPMVHIIIKDKNIGHSHASSVRLEGQVQVPWTFPISPRPPAAPANSRNPAQAGAFSPIPTQLPNSAEHRIVIRCIGVPLYTLSPLRLNQATSGPGPGTPTELN
jgi:hypothetical protein